MLTLGCGLVWLCVNSLFTLFRALKHNRARGQAVVFYILTGAIATLPCAVLLLLASVLKPRSDVSVDASGVVAAFVVCGVMFCLVQKTMLKPPVRVTDQWIAQGVFGALLTCATLLFATAVSGSQPMASALGFIALVLNFAGFSFAKHYAYAIRNVRSGQAGRLRLLFAACAIAFILAGVVAALFAGDFFGPTTPVKNDASAIALPLLAGMATGIAITTLTVLWTTLYLNGMARQRELALVSSLNLARANDDLTKLPNRSTLELAAHQEIDHASASHELFSLVLVRIGSLKQVNSTYGLMTGDAVLLKHVKNLQAIVPAEDILGRVSGDLFGIVSRECDSPDKAMALSSKIIEALQSPISLGRQEFLVNASVGVAMYPTDGRSVDALFTHAHVAVNNARKMTGSHVVFYSTSLSESLRHQADLQSQLRRAISKGQLLVHLQPQFNLETGQLVGAEALVRWKDDQRKLRFPGEFIAVAESSGLIRPIGKIVIELACQTVRSWMDRGMRPVPISVNVSAAQFEDPGFVCTIVELLGQYQVPPQLIHLEITESLAMNDASATEARLEELRAKGFSFSLDDFGTGYSSLAYLTRFRFKQLKIDRSFITGITDQIGNQHIVQAIIMLAKPLGMEVIAEGVETMAEAEWLNAHGCEYVQGYLYGRPIQVEEFNTRWLSPGAQEPPAIHSKVLSDAHAAA